jgi:hypothetical protein
MQGSYSGSAVAYRSPLEHAAAALRPSCNMVNPFNLADAIPDVGKASLFISFAHLCICKASFTLITRSPIYKCLSRAFMPVYPSSCDYYGPVLLHIASCVVGCRVVVHCCALWPFCGLFVSLWTVPLSRSREQLFERCDHELVLPWP